MELGTGNVAADLCEDLTAQPVVLLVRVLAAVSPGVLPVIGDRETPAIAAQPKLTPHAHRPHPRSLSAAMPAGPSWTSAASATC